ncbi:MAG TPA: peptidase T [Gaiella sp.]|nr:peptidase T [Gaiella sp.]
MAETRYASPLAEELAEDVLARFLRYVVIDTQSDPTSTAYPSTDKQLDLSRLLVEELQALRLDDVELTEHGYVFATVPGTVEGAPTVGLIAHVDTAPGVSGTGVTPLVHRGWDGTPLRLPGDPAQVLDPDDMPGLAERVGHDLVTSDGTTLLGADDKAGVAIIVTAAERLLRDDAPRATLRIGFTVDEEVGRGTDHFDLDAFGADFAYTFDGSGVGEVEIETFSAYQLVLTITGVGVHPGSGKGRLVNALKLMGEFLSALPTDGLTPETTEDREGFVHPERLAGTTGSATVWMLARDHDDAKLEEHVALVRRIADRVVGAEPRASFTLDVVEQYRNMRPVLDRHPEIVEAAEEAIRRVGVEPVHNIIRGGTDGARLTEKGLPTPNLFTGGQHYHSEREWASVQDMGAAAATAVELIRLWGERSA